MERRTFAWNAEKNAILRETRGVGFEDVVAAIADDRVLADYPNANYPGQNRLVVEIDGYAVIVSYVSDGEVIFFKTLFPDRKARRKLLGH